MTPDLARLTPAGELRGYDEEETQELRAFFERARNFMLSHSWCRGVSKEHYAFGVGRVFAVFLFWTSIADHEDEWLWVVVGDMPSAYLVTDELPTAVEALRAYTDLMEDWVLAARAGSSLSGVFPVGVSADEEHAAMLASRIECLRTFIIPDFEDESPPEGGTTHG